MTGPQPRAHQEAAIEAIQASLATGPRATALLACGTGKTLTGLWLAQRREAQLTLVVVPSLALIAQTLREWRAGAGSWLFEALVLCSDPATAEGERERVGSDGADIPVPFWARHRAAVTTSASRAAQFLGRARPGRPLVVFSTYHSAPVAGAAAVAAGARFDLLLADEAHNLAGHPRAEFRTVLQEEKVPAAARVFLTATQVTTTPALTPPSWDNWSAPISMDDGALFGPVAYRLDFADAITADLLADYEVLIYETPGQTAPDPVAALVGAAERGLTRVLTFHGRVTKAQAFATAVDGQQLPDGRRVVARCVAGADPATHRAAALRLLEKPAPDTLVVISSARCLAEGVDLPAVDGVMFVDPKSSDVSIIQAVGRVMRKAPGKRCGQVLLPVCVRGDVDADTTLSTSSFAAVWRILRGLRSLDARLAGELATLRRGASRRGVADGSRHRGRLSVCLPSAGDVAGVVARLVEATAPAWDGFFAELEDYAAEHGHSRPPAGHRLHAWCARQRTAYRRGMLLPDRAAALRGLPGWTWDLAEQRWMQQWACVLAAAGRRLRLDDPQVMDRPVPHPQRTVTTIGRWCARQRILARRGELEPAWAAQLEQIPGWVWQALPDVDVACLDLLAEHVAWKHDANVATDYVDDDQPVGQWLAQVRRRRAVDQIALPLLDELVVSTPARGAAGALRWDRAGIQWRLGLEALTQFAARQGSCRVPDGHVEQLTDTSVALAVWCRRQRHLHRHGRLPADRVAALQRLSGWVWEIQPTPRIGIDLGDARHGTRTGYVKGCRCVDCTEANRVAQAARDSCARAGGPSTDLVPAGRACGWLRILLGQGATVKGLARAAQLNPKTVADIANGVRGRIHPETEATIVALTAEDARSATVPGALVAAGPTWRLIDDLVGRGWPKRWIARELGQQEALQLGRDQVTAGTATAVAALHARLEGVAVPPRRHRAPMPPLSDVLGGLARTA